MVRNHEAPVGRAKLVGIAAIVRGENTMLIVSVGNLIASDLSLALSLMFIAEESVLMNLANIPFYQRLQLWGCPFCISCRPGDTTKNVTPLEHVANPVI
ncbi:MAG: hypothetical protein ACFBSC_19970 [Microcoleaceae cyanobacterium]